MRACVALLFAVGLIGDVSATELPRAQPEEMGFSAARLAYLDQFYADKVSQGKMAGIVTLIARHGKIVHFSAVGFSDYEKKKKLETDTIFRLYSMSKPIAAVALMMLYEEGRFQMQEPLSQYIPEFATLRVMRTADSPLEDTVPLERAATMQDVLRHTAGFSHGLTDGVLDKAYRKADVFGLDVTLAEMITRLSKLPLAEQPGKKFVYSVGPDIQGRLVEILSGMAFDEFLHKRLFKPLGMKDAGFWVPSDKAGRLTVVHWLKNGKLVPIDQAHGRPEGLFIQEPASVNSYTVNHRRKGGSYGMVSTPEDYWRFAQMLLNGGQFEGARLMSPQVIGYMARNHLASLQTKGPFDNGFGLGFAVMDDPAAAGFMSSEGSFFWAGAAATNFWVDPRKDLVVVAMSQHMGAPEGDLGLLWPQIRTLVYSALME